MGLYDTFIGDDGVEYQTKALDRLMRTWRTGDEIAAVDGQYEARAYDGRTALVTVRDHRVVAIEGQARNGHDE